MKSLLAFLKKECMEWKRSGRLLSLAAVFVVFGILNPAIAKLTPWLMEAMSESLEGSGLMVGKINVDAMASWTQYYKNLPIAVIVFALMISGSFTSEYNKGSLVLVVTKGLARWKIFIAKTLMFVIMWTGCYWMLYSITYVYNDFYWDNKIANNPFIAAALVWMFGVLIISIIICMSSVASSNATVLIGTCAVILVSYILEMFPRISKYMPTRLMETFSILTGEIKVSEYYPALTIAIILSACALLLGNMLFLRKKL